jgi:hypothetical protein
MGDDKAPEITRDPAPVRDAAPSGPSLLPDPALASQDAMGNAGVAQMLQRRQGAAPAGAPPPASGVPPALADPLVAAPSLILSGITGRPQVVLAMANQMLDVDLKGETHFEPDMLLASWIEVRGRTSVRARFGDLAAGDMVIWRDDQGYQSQLTWLAMSHPELRPRAAIDQVGLAVKIENGAISGKIGVMRYPPAHPHAGVMYHASEDRLRPILFGRSFEDDYGLKLDQWENGLRGGDLVLNAGFRLQPPDGPEIVGRFALLNEQAVMDAGVQIETPGLQAARLPVARTPSGLLTARQPVEFSQDWKARGFEGQVTASFVDGSFDARARVKFGFPSSGNDKRLSGMVTVVATSHDRAWELARSHSPAPAAAAGIEPARRGGGMALTGWGTLDLVITKGLGASAAFVVDPDGYLTARGVLRTPREVELLRYEWKPDPLLTTHWTIADVPLFFGALATAEVTFNLTAGATVIFSLRDILVQGLYSTRPGVGTQLDVAASFNASLLAWLEASAKLSGSAKLGFKLNLKYWEPELTLTLITVDVGITGRGELLAYANARPRFRLESGGNDPATAAKYRIGGRIEAGGEVDLSLSITGGIDLLGIFKPGVSFGITKYPVAGASIFADFDYEIGSDERPKLQFGTGNFEPHKFVRDIRRGRTPADSDRPVHGAFTEKGTGETSKVTGNAPEKLPKLSPADFELRVPFEIANKAHELFLEMKDPPVLEMASGDRDPLLPKLAAADEQVQSVESTETDPDRKVLLEQQHQDLVVLENATVAVQAEADKLDENPALVSSAELPGVGEVATELAEYGERYQDTEVTGVTPAPTAPIEPTQVQAVQTVAPNTMAPAPGFNINVEEASELSRRQFRDATTRYEMWEGLVAMPYVRDVLGPRDVPPGLTLQEQYTIRHPRDRREFKIPEGVFFNPQLEDAQQTDIVIAEVTLNSAFFAQNRRGFRHETGEHKIDQIPRTLNIAAARWPNARIHYIVISNVQPGETTANWLENQVLNARTGLDPNRISIEWRVLPVRERVPPPGQPTPP